MRKEKIVKVDGTLYGWEFLAENPLGINTRNDFVNFLGIINGLNGDLGYLHVNILPRTLFENVDYIERNILPHRPNLVVEIIEDDVDRGLLEDLADRLRGTGIRVSIDDFGTSASNFDRIMLFKDNLQSVKIDRVLWADRDKKDIVLSILENLKREGIDTIAEKVESREEFELVKELGFNAVQGYFLKEIGDGHNK